MTDVKRDKEDIGCPVCGTKDVFAFLNINGMPIYCNVLWPSFEEAIRAPKGDICLALCEICGHIFNYCFDPGLMDYGQNYENSLHFSPIFQSYAKSLAKELIQKHNLYNKIVIEIGCGKGDFLKLLCEEGNNFGYGFDKSYEPDRHNRITGRVKFISDYYDYRYANIKADFICCRHVLEHIQRPIEFLSKVREDSKANTDAVFFFEVPNAMFIIKDLSIWDIIYEHSGYFSKRSISRAFRSAGYDVLNVKEAFGGQYLTIEATSSLLEDNEKIKLENNKINRRLIGKFVFDYESFINSCREKMNTYRKLQKKVVIWGGGSKGVTFSNLVGNDVLKYIVDINPHKQGKFIPVTGQQIVKPNFLCQYVPDIIILMNSNYCREIETMRNQMGISSKIVTI